MYTIQPCTSIQRHFMQTHLRRVRVCFAVTCYLHLCQNYQDHLRATAVTQGCYSYRNNSQHRKLTLEKRILPSLPPGFEHETFRSRVRRSNTEPSSSLLVEIFRVLFSLWPSSVLPSSTDHTDCWIWGAQDGHLHFHTSPELGNACWLDLLTDRQCIRLNCCRVCN